MVAGLQETITTRFGPIRATAARGVNSNPKRTNVILGPETRVLFGAPAIRDVLAGVEGGISPPP